MKKNKPYYSLRKDEIDKLHNDHRELSHEYEDIFKTIAAMIVRVVPLVTASGAGAEGRYNMGLVIMTGIAIGTLFTIFVVPGMYLLLAAEHSKAGTEQK